MLTQKVTNEEREQHKRVVEAIKSYDKSYTYKHCMRTGKIASILASHLGKTKDECEIIRMAGEIHDIGKVKVNKTLLYTDRKLTVDEFKEMKKHTVLGTELLKSSGLKRPEYYEAAEEHHAFYEPGNGGYGAKEYESDKHPSEIAQIMAIADVYEALSSARPYKEACPTNEIRDILESDFERGHFNPEIYDVFMTEMFDSLENERLLEQAKEKALNKDAKKEELSTEEVILDEKLAPNEQMTDTKQKTL